MTDFLIDLASYQDGINLNVVKAAGFNKVNVKLSQGKWYKWSNAQKYINEARNLGFGICTFHWLDNSDTGANQARIVQSLMKQYGGPSGMAHQCDCEDTKKPATWQIWKDYVNSMQDFLGRHVVNYTGDWWWSSHMGSNPASSVTPYLWAAPNDGYLSSYPGDTSSYWHAGYGGWNNYSILQYSVSQISNAGGGALSKSAIKDSLVWKELTGGAKMTGFDETAGRRLESAEAHAWAIRTGERPDTWVGGTSNKTNNGNPLFDLLNEIKTEVLAVKTLGGALQPTVDVNVLADRITQGLIASNTNGLTMADHDAVVADVKKALREGSGT